MTGSRLGRWIAPAVLALILAAAAVVVLVIERQSAALPSRAQELAIALDRTLERKTRSSSGVAVLPFSAPTGDQGLIDLGDALCDAIVERLSRAPDVRATSCRSSRVGAEHGLAGGQLGHLLDVDRVLQGSVARTPAGRFVVHASLRDVRRERELWRIDDELDEPRLQDLPLRLAARIAGEPFVSPGTAAVDPEVYRLYLRALGLGRRGNPEDLRAAIPLFDQVLARAPDHVPAHIARALTLTGLHSMVGEPDGQKLQHEREAAATRVLRLDPENGHARLILADVAVGKADWLRAFELADQASALRPSDALTQRYLASLLRLTGYLKEARSVAQRAALADPMSANGHRLIANIDILLGDDQRMQEHVNLARDLGMREAMVYKWIPALRRRDFATAQNELAAGMREIGHDGPWIGPFIQAAADPRWRDAAVRALDAEPAGSRAASDEFFYFYAAAGAPEPALRALLVQSKQMPSDWVSHVWSPEMANVRRLDGFASYLERMKLAPLWDQRGAPDLCTRTSGGTYRCR